MSKNIVTIMVKKGEVRMFSKIVSCSLQGIESNIIHVEVDLANALPSFNIVGLPDMEVKESKERVKASIVNSGFKFPSKRIIVNLAPSSIRKTGTHFDLPIAIGILYALNHIKEKKIHKYAMLGELSLDGKINPVHGVLPLVLGLKDKGITKVILPHKNADEAALVKDMEVRGFSKLNDVVDFLNKRIALSPHLSERQGEELDSDIVYDDDFSDILGQDSAKRALQIAATGAHNILLVGPPGGGKTMLATRMPSILPTLTYDERLEIAKIYSIVGKLPQSKILSMGRPFQSPHHSISLSGMVGGGNIPRPGEISLAHLGVLFLDEVPEFKREVLEALRQPMEDESIAIVRVNATYRFPTKFILIGSMNPCPCGYFGDDRHECTCTMAEINRYHSKISGPFMDRMDMFIKIWPIEYDDLNGKRKVKSSKDMKNEIEIAREIQKSRYKNSSINYNSQLSPYLIKKYCKLNQESQALLKEAFEKMGLSTRAYYKIIKLSRTIADIDNSEDIKTNHLAEALQYRNNAINIR